MITIIKKIESSTIGSEYTENNLKKRIGYFLLFFAIFFFLSASWSLITPPGSSPDEPAHIIKAVSVANGNFYPKTSDKDPTTTVPEYAKETHKSGCYVLKKSSDLGSNCLSTKKLNSNKKVKAITSAANYNPIYYSIISFPSKIIENQNAIYLMRLTSAALVSIVLAGTAVTLISWRKRRIALFGLLFGLTPSMFYFSGNINPNAIEAVSCLAIFVLLVTIIAQWESAKILLPERVLLLCFTATFATNSKKASLLFAAISFLIPLLLFSFQKVKPLLKNPLIIAAIGYIGIATVFSLYWSNTSELIVIPEDPTPIEKNSDVENNDISDNDIENNNTNEGANKSSQVTKEKYPHTGKNFSFGFWYTLANTPRLFRGAIALFGWNTIDVFLSLAIWVALALIIIVVFIKNFNRHNRAYIITTLLMLMYIFIPPVIQGRLIHSLGFIWQGRYMLPLLLITTFLLIVTTFNEKQKGKTLYLLNKNTWIKITLALAIFTMHFVAMMQVLIHYTGGKAQTLANFFNEISWAPPLGATPTFILLLLSCSLFTLLNFKIIHNKNIKAKPFSSVS